MDFKNKTVLITGSSSGIGKETAILFSKKGAKVIITYNRYKTNGKKVLEECKKYTKAKLLHLDISKEISIKKLVKKIKNLDILINNAGIIRWKNLENQSRADIEDQININLLGPIKLTNYLLPKLRKQKEAIIINIASGAAKQAHAGLSVYCATKFGLRGFTQTIAKELPNNIRAFCVNPGMTATRMTKYRGVSPEKVAEIIVLAAEEKLRKHTGDDIDVWNYV